MSNDTIPHKKCTKCNQTFPATIEFFYPDKRKKDGLDTRCKICVLEYARTYKQKNREKVIETQRKHRLKHRKQIADYMREYAENNREKVRDNQRKYRQANIDRVRAANRKYSKENPVKNRAAQARRRARERALPDTFNHNQWIVCLEYFNYCCAVCGSQLHDMFGDIEPHIDHWIPISYEGDDNPGTVAENIVCLCNICNQSKSAKMPKVWLVEVYGTRKANKILKRIAEYFNQIG